MTKKQQDTEKAFADALVTRLKIRRNTSEGDVYVLDLRHRRFGNKNPRIVRCPSDAGWPVKGRPTGDHGLAEQWVRAAYARVLFQELQNVGSASLARGSTFARAAQAYIDHKMKLFGKDGLRSINSRISMLRAHVIPAIGKLPLRSITRQIIREKAEALTVSKVVVPGKRKLAEAELGTKRNFIRSATAVWKYTFPDEPCPYAGVRLANEQAKMQRRKALAEGNFEELLKPKSGAMRKSEFQHALTAALYYDTHVGGRRNMKAAMIANTIYAMVIQTALGVRISELCMLRWGYIHFDERYVIVTGTKTLNAFRVVPLQEQLVPWLVELKAMQGGNPDPRSFIIRTNPKKGQFEPAAVNTLISRYARTLKLAGLKRAKKATHWTRATHATWANRSGLVAIENLKAYLGHAAPYGGSTDLYIDEILEDMPDSHRTYIRNIPTPADVRASLAEFKPAELAHWRERRKWYSRSKQAREEQRARGRARKPMYGKLQPGAIEEPPHPLAVAFGFAEKD